MIMQIDHNLLTTRVETHDTIRHYRNKYVIKVRITDQFSDEITMVPCSIS